MGVGPKSGVATGHVVPLSHYYAQKHVSSSGYHNWWDGERFDLYVAVPDKLGQLYVDKNFLVTWGFPTEDQALEYVDTGLFESDWFAGGGSDLWIVDFICLGGKVGIIRSFRHLIGMFADMGFSEAYWLRTETGKVGWFRLKEG